MKFEILPPDPGEKYSHKITFESDDESLAIWSAYRELVVRKTLAHLPVADHELAASELWAEKGGNISTSDPEAIATILEDFHRKTGKATLAIARRLEAPFRSDDIALRIRLGKIADELSGLIRGNQRAIDLFSEIEGQEPILLTEGDDHKADHGA